MSDDILTTKEICRDLNDATEKAIINENKLTRAEKIIENVKRCKQQPCCQCIEAIDKYLEIIE